MAARKAPPCDCGGKIIAHGRSRPPRWKCQGCGHIYDAGAMNALCVLTEDDPEAEARPRLQPCQLVTDEVMVCCPHCGGPQPNPARHGDEQWGKEDFAKLTETKTLCVECDGPILIQLFQKAQFQ